MNSKELSDKLLSRGVGEMTDAEIIAILTDDDNGVLSDDKIAHLLDGTSLAQLSVAEPVKLRQRGSMGITRAIRLAAAFELGRRVRSQGCEKIESITSSQDVIELFQPMLSHIKHEEFWVLYLNSAHKIIDKVRAGQGGVSNLIVDHKLIIKRALELLSSAIVVVHNHPSGEAQPSEADIVLTNKLVTAASLFDIELLDHIIITSGNCLSFRAQKLIE